MLSNIVLAVVAGICQFINSFLGYKVTGAVSPKSKAAYDSIFIISGLVGIVCIGLLAYRGARSERAHFSVYYANAYAGSWLVVDKPLAINISYTNQGTGTAYRFLPTGRSYIENDLSKDSQEDAVAKFKSDIASSPPPPGDSGSSMSKNEGGFFTTSGPILSPEDFDNLQHGRRVAIFVAIMKWQDDFGSHTKHICVMLQPPVGNVFVFNHCEGYNDEN